MSMRLAWERGRCRRFFDELKEERVAARSEVCGCGRHLLAGEERLDHEKIMITR
jgi:hypothetical protein